MQTLERTRKVVAECLGQDVTGIRAGSRLVIDLGAESLDLLELVFLLEKEFRLPLDADDLIPRAHDQGRAAVDRLTVMDVATVLEGKLMGSSTAVRSASEG